MKTNTKSQIIEIIRNNGAMRPADLVRKLKISPQAIHRHLKDLVKKEVLERRGNPPSTRYTITDIPNFRDVLLWYKSKQAQSEQRVCETRDSFSGRLNHLEQLKISRKELSLLISATGEIGNNSFDHNMGKWKDVPGCWFEKQTTKNRFWVLIADRGQGIYKSLAKVVKPSKNGQNLVKKAFEEQLSGRAPEKRGNGLKFVKNTILESSGRGIACLSGRGSVFYGTLGEDCLKILESIPYQNFGTITLMTWEKNDN